MKNKNSKNQYFSRSRLRYPQAPEKKILSGAASFLSRELIFNKNRLEIKQRK